MEYRLIFYDEPLADIDKIRFEKDREELSEILCKEYGVEKQMSPIQYREQLEVKCIYHIPSGPKGLRAKNCIGFIVEYLMDRGYIVHIESFRHADIQDMAHNMAITVFDGL